MFQLIQLHFVIGDYRRRFGDIEMAKESFAKARKVEWVDKDGQAQIGSEYIEKLIVERLELIEE